MAESPRSAYLRQGVQFWARMEDDGDTKPWSQKKGADGAFLILLLHMVEADVVHFNLE